jgi:hypothetical protein
MNRYGGDPCRPYGTRFIFPRLPGTSVPGFHITPLRGLVLFPCHPRLTPLRQAQGKLWAAFFCRPSTPLRAGFRDCIPARRRGRCTRDPSLRLKKGCAQDDADKRVDDWNPNYTSPIILIRPPLGVGGWGRAPGIFLCVELRSGRPASRGRRRRLGPIRTRRRRRR